MGQKIPVCYQWILKLKVLVVLLLIYLTVYVFMSRGYIGSLVHPLPFEVPCNGTIIDASSGTLVEDARVMADWWCYDSPDPHLGNYWVHVIVSSGENGRYEIQNNQADPVTYRRISCPWIRIGE